MDRDRSRDGVGSRLFRNTLHAITGRMAGLILWLVFTPAILAELGRERFAIWSLFFALTSYLAALDLGLVQATVRFVAAARGRGDHGEAGAFATLSLAGYAALAMVWGLCAWLGSELILGWLRIPPELRGDALFGLRIGAAVFLLNGVANVTMAIAQGYGRFDVANRILLWMALQQAAGMMLVVWRHWGFAGFVLNVAAGGVFGTVLGIVFLARDLREFRWSPVARALPGMRASLRFGLPMQATNVLAAINVHLDKLLIARFTNLGGVTSYELGSRVANAAASLPQLLLTPVLTESAAMSAAGQRERLHELYQRGSRYFLTLSAMCVAPLLAAAPRLYLAWLGPDHRDSAQVLRWLTVAAGFSLTTGMGTTIARGLARTELETWFAVVTVSLHLGLSFALLPRLGLVGALIASVTSHLAGSVLFMVLFARLMGWRLLAEVLMPWVVPVLAVVAGWLAGAGLDLVLPSPGGWAGWLAFAGVAAIAGVVAFGVTVVTRYFHWREALSLVRGGPLAALGRRG